MLPQWYYKHGIMVKRSSQRLYVTRGQQFHEVLQYPQPAGRTLEVLEVLEVVTDACRLPNTGHPVPHYTVQCFHLNSALLHLWVFRMSRVAGTKLCKYPRASLSHYARRRLPQPPSAPLSLISCCVVCPTTATLLYTSISHKIIHFISRERRAEMMCTN